MPIHPIRCDIFCKVIDNFGDVGVCWRLATQLSDEFGWHLRIFVDDASALEWMASQAQRNSVAVRHFDAALYDGGDVVIEAFACEIPVTYQAAMAKRKPPPVWLNLEYLSAESWVTQSHGLRSIHPRLGITKHFFFPGFESGTGGLIRERDYKLRHKDFNADQFRQRLSLPGARAGEMLISMFCYPSAPLETLCAAWANSPAPITALVPGSNENFQTVGNLRLVPTPFLTQQEYDELLWVCDLNFVRGEDSFVRAQWAEKPMVWQIYPQDSDAQLVKLDAFMTRYPPVGAGDTPVKKFWSAWNGVGELDWPTFARTLPQQEQGATAWADELRQHPDLATNLRDFCLTQLNLG